MRELKKLAHELFQLRDGHLEEIEKLKKCLYDATQCASANEAAMVGNMSEMFPSDEMATAREEAARLQVGKWILNEALCDQVVYGVSVETGR